MLSGINRVVWARTGAEAGVSLSDTRGSMLVLPAQRDWDTEHVLGLSWKYVCAPPSHKKVQFTEVQIKQMSRLVCCYIR